MELSKISFLTLATASLLTLSSPAFANPTNSMQTQSALLKAQTPQLIFNNHSLRGYHAQERIAGSSDTATVYYRKGVSSFETGEFDKAAQHFRAALRADGSRGRHIITLPLSLGSRVTRPERVNMSRPITV